MKIVVLSDNHAKAMILKNMLTKEPSFQVLCCSDNSKEGVESIQSYHPHVIIYAPCLKYDEGINIIQDLRSNGFSGKVLLMMENTLPASVNLALNFNSDYIMFYPLDSYSAISYIKELPDNKVVETLAHNVDNASTVMIQKTLDMLGISQHLNGYKYLVQAVKLCYDNPNLLTCKTKYLYPELSKLNNINVANIERCMRNAIQKAWNNQDRKNFLSVINPAYAKSNKRPTCSTVIEAVTAYVNENTIKQNYFI